MQKSNILYKIYHKIFLKNVSIFENSSAQQKEATAIFLGTKRFHFIKKKKYEKYLQFILDRAKFEADIVHFICADIEEAYLPCDFDCCMVYNAFPHFPDPGNLIKVLSSWLKRGGRLSVAHGMSRAKIDRHHEGSACKVSRGLMSETELARLMEPYFNVDVVISDDRMYQVAGVKK